jgi:hypothetical protein
MPDDHVHAADAAREEYPDVGAEVVAMLADSASPTDDLQ